MYFLSVSHKLCFFIGFFEANSADLSLSYVQEQNIRLGVNATVSIPILTDYYHTLLQIM